MKVLKGGAVGPDGVHVEAGHPPAKDWPDWFLADLEEHGALVDGESATSSGDSDAVQVEGRSSRGRKATR